MFACIHGPAADLSQIAEAFSPAFEQTSPGTIVFRVDCLKRLYGFAHSKSLKRSWNGRLDKSM